MGLPILFRGTCWNTSPNPTTADFHTTDGNATGVFTSNLLGLTANTCYYVRAYAVNSNGTTYGDEIKFTTKFSVTTYPGTNISPSTAICGGSIPIVGNKDIIARGVCWSISNNLPTLADNHTSDGVGSGIFTSTLTGLTSNTAYYTRAYAINGVDTAYGMVETFVTSIGVPILSTTPATFITSSNAFCGGNITSNGGANITENGLCWSISPNPTIADNKITCGSGNAFFSGTIIGLAPITLYYVKAYAINSAGTGYGNQISFTTQQNPSLPTVSTAQVIQLTDTTALGGGNVLSDGGLSVIFRGVCWSTNHNPTIVDSHSTDGSGSGIYTSNLSGLNFNSTNYVRGYAQNSLGTAYGNEVTICKAAIIGNGTTEVGYPFYSFYMGSRTQMLYLASELITAGLTSGTIAQIGFNFTTTSSQILQNFAIKMTNSLNTTLTGWVTSNMTTCYQTNYSVPGTGWKTILLTTPFQWDGTSNIIVEVCFGMNGSYTSNSNVTGTSASGKTWHYHNDTNAGCTGTNVGAVANVRPNIQFIKVCQ